MEPNHDMQVDAEKVLMRLLFLFYIVYTVCAIFMQIRSGELPSTAASAIDMFIGSILWMISMTCVLLAVVHMQIKWKVMIWLGVSACAGLLAIDEMFEFHEHAKGMFEDDDYIKILTLPIAFAGMYVLYVMEKPSRRVMALFLAGFVFHSLYVFTDLGDGDFFQLPFSRIILVWTEEILELFALQSYLAGFLVHYLTLSRRVYRAQ